MSVINAIDKILNEATSWKEGMWVVQKRSGENEYALLVQKTKKGWMGITIDDDRMIAGKRSITNAYPPFEPIPYAKIPPKIESKVIKKLNSLNIKISGVNA